MKNTSIVTAFLLIIYFCSCSGETDTPEPPVIPEKIPINLSVGVETRATDTSFEISDEIGIYVVNYNNGSPAVLKNTGNHVDNMKYTYTNIGWTPETPIYWKDENTKADFYSFYPYIPVSNVSNHTFELKADQSALDNYKSSDFLWGRSTGISPSVSAVNIIMKYLFSNVIVKVEPEDGFTAEELAACEVSVCLNQIKSTASIDLVTGTTSVIGNAGKLIPLFTNGSYKALIVPQIVPADNFITVTVDGEEFSLHKEFTFIAGKQQTLTVKVNKTNNGMYLSIGAWETDDRDHGGVAI